MSEAGWSPAGSDGTYQYATAALSVFWPEEQFRILVARWPHLAARVGATWDEHRRRVEQHRAFLDQEGLRFQQLPGDVSSLVTFLAARKVTKPGDDDLNAYPDLRTVTTPMTAWPPARTAPCWCGSGRKYKQCCRRYGLGTLVVGNIRT
ncbi:MAG: SEC-C domain-containing protein [Pseudonocardiales bacterium]|nr:SEC-C domain-containing protein [Pseudonocardiales bacterium]